MDQIRELARVFAQTADLTTLSDALSLKANAADIPAASILSGNFTVATLPDAEANTRKYAWVTDLHDSHPDLCLSDGVSWKPVRPIGATMVEDGNQALTFMPLLNAPTQLIGSGSALSANRDWMISTSRAYFGQQFRIMRRAGGLFNGLVKVDATLLGTIPANSWADFEYFGATDSWLQTGSGGLL